jgi:Holliday junction resolvasome RuvABC ATP-dependent DNA helicase subunit
MDSGNKNLTPIGITNWRDEQIPFGIKDKDRLQHIYVIGKTGVGKSTLLLNMAISDIQKNKGMALLDPHGDIATEILDFIPKERIQDVIYFNPLDEDYPIPFNPLSQVPEQFHHLVASGIISTFKKIWADNWGPRLEHILRFCLLTLLHYPKATLLHIQPLLTNKEFRLHVLTHIKTTYILEFWHNEFEKFSPALRAEAVSPILNKVGLFHTSEPLRNIVGQTKSSINIKSLMQEGKILIANLSKGQLGEEVSSMLGSMLVTAIELAALSRSLEEENTRVPYYLFVDEVHSFVSLSFADILSEARKYGLSLFMAHQYIDQLPEKIRLAIFGNVGTIISFRIGSHDGTFLRDEFYPVFDESDLVHLPKYSMYLKLMIDGTTSKPFSAISNALNKNKHHLKKEVIESSRKIYGGVIEKQKCNNEFEFKESQSRLFS